MKLDPDIFFKRLSDSKNRILLLDYDGTLAPHCVERDKAYPYPKVREILDKLLDCVNTRLVIISGRFIKDLIPLLGLKRLPEMFGSHGCERRKSDGTYEIAELDTETASIFDEVDKWLKGEGLLGLLEVKPVSRAIHLRGVKEAEAASIKEKVTAHFNELSGDGLVVVHEFNGGIELRTPGRDKGTAIETILSESGDDAFIVYLGDDLTDEDAFRALKGRGVGILVAREERETDADYQIEPPDELIEFLTRWGNICRGGQ